MFNKEFTLTPSDEAIDVGTENVDVSTEERGVETDDEEVGMDDEEVGMDDEEVGMDDEEVGIEDEEVGIEDEEVGIDDEVGMDNEEVGMDDEKAGMDDEKVGMDDEEVGTGAGEIGTDNDNGGTGTGEVETGVEEVVIAELMANEEVEEITTGTVGTKVGVTRGTALEDSAVTELDTVGVVESVHVLISCTSPPEIGVNVMIQVCLTTPVGLEKEISVMSSIRGDPDIRIYKVDTGDSRGLGSGELREWVRGELWELSRGMSRSDVRWLIESVVK